MWSEKVRSQEMESNRSSAYTGNFSRLLAASDQHFADMQSTLIVVDRLGRFLTPPARHIAWHNGSALSLEARWYEVRGHVHSSMVLSSLILAMPSCPKGSMWLSKSQSSPFIVVQVNPNMNPAASGQKIVTRPIQRTATFP